MATSNGAVPVTNGAVAGHATQLGARAPMGRARWGALGAVGLSAVAVLADFMAVSVALPAIQRSTGASFVQLQWVLEAYVLTLAVFLMVSGYLSDRFGERPVLLAGLAIFAASAAVAGVAGSPYLLIGARAFQGVGAAMLAPTGTVVLTEAFGEAGSRLALAAWSGATGFAVAASPLVGGLLAGELSWRWIFFLEAALVFVALAMAARSVVGAPPDRKAAQGTQPDWLGLTLFAAAVTILVIGLLRTTSDLDGWKSSGVLACFACTGLLLVAFVATEAVSRSPAFPVALFRRRTFAGASAAAFGVSMAVLGPFMLLVWYLSYDLGYSPLGVGVRLLALSGVTLPLLVLGVPLWRFVPAKILVFGGLALVAVGLWAMSRLAATSGWAELAPGLVIAGAGLELLNPHLAAAAAAAVEPRSAPAAYRATSTVRQLGVATGVAVSASVFATRLTDAVAQQLPAGSRLSGQQVQVAGLVLHGHFAAAAGAAGQAVVQASFASAMHDALLVAAAAAAVCAVLALVVRSADIPGTGPVPGPVPGPVTSPLAHHLPAHPLAAPAAPTPVPALVGPAAAVTAQPAATAGVSGPSAPSGPTGDVNPPLPARPLPQRTLGARSAGPAASNGPGRDNGTGRTELGVAGTTGGTAIAWAAAENQPYFVKGLVTAVTGEAVAGASLTLVGPRGNHAAVGKTLDDGSFALDAEQGGMYTLVAAALGYRATAKVVKVGAGGARTDLRLFGTGSLTGRVADAKDGSPLGAELELRERQGQLAMRCRSAPDGSFTFDQVLEGAYELVASAVGHKAQTAAVSVARGAPSTAELVLPGVGHVYGAVSSPEGAWLPGVSVSLASPSGEIEATTSTDDAGSYHFAEVPEGSWLLSVGSSPGEVAASPMGAGSLPIEVAAGATVAADLVLACG